MLHPPPIFQLNLQSQTLKFICQDLITIPTRPSLWSYRRTIVTSAEIKKRYKHSRHPPSISVWQTNSRQKLEENDSLRKRTKMIDIEPVTPPNHPRGHLPPRLSPNRASYSRFISRCSTMWIRVVFFFIQTATYRIDWISRDEKKDGINLGDVKFFENKILMNYLGNYIE